jgi:hypothetical protein
VGEELEIKIFNPEISQAFYGELKGNPVFYSISSDKEFNLYLGILSPKIKGSDKDFSAEIFKIVEDEQELIYFLDGLTLEWKEFYEEFAGDEYWRGPQFPLQEKDIPIGKRVDSGDYRIKVFSQDNYGKYVLSVGTIESFNLKETIETIKTLPKLKSEFWNKPIYSSFFNLIGLFLLISILVILSLVILIIWIIKKFVFKR